MISDEQAEHIVAMGDLRFRPGIDDKPVHYSDIESCDSRLDRIITGDVVGGDGGAYLFVAMYSGWDYFDCAWADGIGFGVGRTIRCIDQFGTREDEMSNIPFWQSVQ